MNRQTALGAPARIQRQHTKGWRAPHGAVYVGRGTPWGNPYTLREHAGHHLVTSPERGVIYASTDEDDARRVAADWYRAWFSSQAGLLAAIRRQLAGRDLMCWCPPPAPGGPDHCHAAVLLALANEAGR
ncbi:DUF4326 domain-containing protein [Streptomyces sp. NPDC050263]|uniref:DUF4326 domain-containing protein n=1 Tax=Streptomyces sp. NPDC050263 TaxID=3155037 RepID=UPI0034132E47